MRPKGNVKHIINDLIMYIHTLGWAVVTCHDGGHRSMVKFVLV